MFDWLTPLLALLLDWRNRPAVHFAVPADALLPAAWLRDKGIHTWGWLPRKGRTPAADKMIFSCRQAQANYCAYWLSRFGVPYACSYALQPTKPRKRRR